MALSLQEPTAHPIRWPERQSSAPPLPFPCRELLRCEAALARLYCRMALLNIFAPKLPHLFTRLFHIPAIRDITLEHLPEHAEQDTCSLAKESLGSPGGQACSVNPASRK